MKKLTTLFILVFLAVGLFAEPIVISNNSGYENPFIYIDNSLTNNYTIFSFTGENETETFMNTEINSYPHHIDIYNISLISGACILLEVHFANIKSMNSFIEKYFSNKDSSEIPNIFATLRQIVSTKGAEPEYYYNKQTNQLENIKYYLRWK